MARTKDWKYKNGRGYVHRLDEVALVIGKDSFTRRELVAIVGVGNFTAAENLTQALKDFKPKSVLELADRIDNKTLRGLDGVGDAAQFVWGMLLIHNGIHPLKWSRKKLETKVVSSKVTRKRRHPHLRLVRSA